MVKRVERTADFQTITYGISAPHVARIVLNRPDSRNAQTPEMLYELNDAFDLAARDDEVKVIILSAEGPHFSSGHDLRITDFVGEMEPFEPIGTWCGFTCKGAEGRMAVEQEMFIGLCERWRNIPKITIAQVQDKAIAGGLMLVCLTDLAIAADDARFTLAYIGIASSPDCGGSWALPRLLGRRKAIELAWLSEPVSSAEALRLGLVNKVVPAAELRQAALSMARRIAAGPPAAMVRTRSLLDAAKATSLSDHLTAELDAFVEGAGSEEFDEAIDAFFGKRPAVFR